VRILFTDAHKIDFVGLITKNLGRFISLRGIIRDVKHSSGGISPQKIFFSDDRHVVIKPGEWLRIRFNFRPRIESFRGYKAFLLLYLEGYYKSLNGHNSTNIFIPDSPSYEGWLDILKKAIHEKGVIWVDIAGISAYYVDNKDWLNSPYSIGENGLEYLIEKDSNDVVINYDNLLYKIGSFNGRAFAFYDELPSEVPVSRGLKDGFIYLDFCGYYKKTDSEYYGYVAISLGARSLGYLIYSGADQSLDDFHKSYIGVALGIEAARSFLSPQVISQKLIGNDVIGYNNLTVISSLKWEIGSYGYDPTDELYTIDLVLTFSAHYPSTYKYFYNGGYKVGFNLSLLDLDIVGSIQEMYFSINASNLEYLNSQTSYSLVNELLWDAISNILTSLILGSETNIIASAIAGTALTFGIMAYMYDNEIIHYSRIHNNDYHVWIEDLKINTDKDDITVVTIPFTMKLERSFGGTFSFSFSADVWVGYWEVVYDPIDHSNIIWITWHDWDYDRVTIDYSLTLNFV